MKNLTKLTILSVALFMVSACGGKSSQGAPSSSGSDTGSVDTGDSGGGSTDTGSSDSGSTDTGTSDSGSTDSGTDSGSDPVDERTPKEKFEAALAASETSEASVVDQAMTVDYGYGGAPVEFTFKFGSEANGAAFKKTEQNDGYELNTVYGYHNADGEPEGYQYNGDQLQAYSYIREDEFGGLNFSNGILQDGYYSTYGAFNAISKEYAKGLEDVNHDFAVVENDDGSFGFSFGYAATSYGYTSYYYVDAKVGFAADGSIASFRNYKYNLQSSNISVDDENGTFSVNDISSLSHMTLNFSQEVGTRGAIDRPFDSIDAFKVDSYDLMYGGKVINNGDVVEAELTGEYNLSGFTVANVLPTSANFDFESFSITVGENTYGGSWSSYYNSFMLSIREAGEYAVTITSSKNIVKSFTVKAIAPGLKGFNFKVAKYNEQYEYWDTYSALSDKMYLGKSVNIYCTPDPDTADGAYTLSCDKATLTTGVAETWSGDITYYTFTPDAVGDYTFTATSTVDPTVSSTFVVSVVAAPTAKDIFAGSYYYLNQRAGYVQESITFEASNEDGTAGTATVCSYSQPTNYTEYMGEVALTSTYSYVVEAGVASFTYVSGDKSMNPVSASANDDMNLEVEVEDFGTIVFYTMDYIQDLWG